jgi:multiple sugar transport system substrate-binding protein
VKQKKKWTSLALALAGAMVLAACSSGTTSGSSDSSSSEGTSDSGSSVTQGIQLALYHDKQGWDERFLLVSDAIAADVGHTLSPTTYGDTTSYQNVLQQAALTGDGPDLFTWWSGYRMVDGAKGGLFADISDVWADAIAAGDVAADLQSQFQVDGKTYGIPNGVSYWPMFYNKKKFEELGLSAPETWAEFINVCDTLKANGITPITASIDGRWPAFIWFEQLMISQDPDLYEDLMNNKIKWTDPKVKEVFDIWADMINKGYFTPLDTVFFGEDAAALIAEGTMMPVGTWNNGSIASGGLVGGTDFDAFIIPNIDPNRSQKSIIVESGTVGALASSPNLAEAKQALRSWLRDGAQQAWADVALDGVPNPRISTADPVIKGLASRVASDNVRLVQRFWEFGPVPFIEGGVDDLGAFMLNPKSVDKVLADLQARADTEWAAWIAKYGS